MKRTLLLALCTLAIWGCKKDNVEPELALEVQTAAVSQVTPQGAVCGGTISNLNSRMPSAVGVCWSETENPAVADSKTVDQLSGNSFTSTIAGLTPGKTYYVRAYATNGKGTFYGEQREIATEGYDAATNTVYTVTAGTLTRLLSAHSPNTITTLKVVGPVNRADFEFLNGMAALAVLDLGGANTEYIPGLAFKGKTSLTSVTLPQTITVINDQAFMDCTGLAGNLVIPDNVTFIGQHAFYGCTGLTGTLTLSSKLENIMGAAFMDCGFTGSLTIPNSVTTIDLLAFKNCAGFNGTLTLGNNIETIEKSTFSGCSGFTGSLTIPNSVTSIGDFAFDNCEGLNGNLTLSNNVAEIGMYAFTNCGFTGNLVIPDGVTEIGSGAFSYNNFNGTLTIGSNVKLIGESVFTGNGFTGSLTIPNSVTEIGIYAFLGCTGFNGALTIGSGVETIGLAAFFNCQGFSKVVAMPQTPPAAEVNAFYGVTNKPLEVPTGKIPAYRGAPEWGMFTVIREMAQ